MEQILSSAGESVSQFKHTILLLPSGPVVVTGIDFPADHYKSENSVTDPEMKVRTRETLNIYAR